MSDVATVDALRVINFSAISGTYAQVGTALEYITRIICFTNNTDGDLIVSLSRGAPFEDNLIMPAGSFKLFDLTTNKGQVNTTWVFPPGTPFYVKQLTAPTSGNFYVECIHQR